MLLEEQYLSLCYNLQNIVTVKQLMMMFRINFYLKFIIISSTKKIVYQKMINGIVVVSIAFTTLLREKPE